MCAEKLTFLLYALIYANDVSKILFFLSCDHVAIHNAGSVC